jgi:hypothetical protein
MHTSREVVLENVRRYRAIASLYRQTAAFRPLQSCSLLSQAKEWEYLALTVLESYFTAGAPDYDQRIGERRITLRPSLPELLRASR